MYLCYQSSPTLSPAGPPAPGLVEPIVWNRGSIQKQGKFRFPSEKRNFGSFRSRAHALLTGCGRNYFRIWAEEEERFSRDLYSSCRLGASGSASAHGPPPPSLTLGVIAPSVKRQPFLLGILSWRQGPPLPSVLCEQWNYTEHKVKEKKFRLYFTT